jgi:flagella basal body P-ring formation protein FlgA
MVPRPQTTSIYFNVMRQILTLFLILVGINAQAETTTRVVTGLEMQEAIIDRLSTAGEVAAPNVLPEKQFYACDAPLEVEPAFGGWRSVIVRCPSPVEWEVTVRAQVKGAVALLPEKSQSYATQAIFLRRPLRSGARIQADDVETRPIDPLVANNIYTEPADVIGRVLSQSMTTRVPVMPRHLEREWAINADDTVSIQIVRGGIEIESSGIALEAGQIGDTIRILNVSSGSELIGRIVQEKKVEIISKALQ